VQAVSSDDNSKRIFSTFRQGDFFGEQGLLGGRRTSDVISLEASELLEIHRHPFQKILIAFPAFEKAFHQCFRKSKYADVVPIELAAQVMTAKIPVLLAAGGYVAQLCGLVGSLAQYNQSIVKPRLIRKDPVRGTEMYEVKLPDGKILAVPPSKLKIGVDRGRVRRLSFAQPQDKKKKPLAHNRSSAKAVLNFLSGQLRTNRLEVEKVFQEFDMDSNGCVSKREMLAGCKAVGIYITPEEIDLVWPIFVKSGKGTSS
jgi:hypothetical protein